MYETETLYSCCTHHKFPWHVLCDISLATQWALGPLHAKDKVRIALLRKVAAVLDVYWVGVSEYGHNTAQAKLKDVICGQKKLSSMADFVCAIAEQVILWIAWKRLQNARKWNTFMQSIQNFC